VLLDELNLLISRSRSSPDVLPSNPTAANMHVVHGHTTL